MRRLVFARAYENENNIDMFIVKNSHLHSDQSHHLDILFHPPTGKKIPTRIHAEMLLMINYHKFCMFYQLIRLYTK